MASDTLSWVHGKHTIKFGAEFRRQNSDNFSYTPGTFTFPSIAAFIADQANGFTVTNVQSLQPDVWKFARRVCDGHLEDGAHAHGDSGLRYDWYGTPTEAGGRFVVFNPAADALQHITTPYQQSALNFQPRVGIAWDPFKNGKTVIRSGVLDHDRSADARSGYRIGGNPAATRFRFRSRRPPRYRS